MPMAICKLKQSQGGDISPREEEEEEEEEVLEVLVIDSEESDDCFPLDDSDDDPTFDILEETRSGFSKMSLKKTRPRMSSEIKAQREEVPELDKKDVECFAKIEKLIKDGQWEKLKIDQYKIYLRKYGLRLTGKKDVLIGRIKEHLEVINGGGEKRYPPSSFVLNCKGDACTGDVVMFEQNVYEMFNIASRSATGPSCGTRVVAGRIVKESYGAAKQQHTFTIEVLWSKGEKPLPPLHPLLIKGRNLYKLKTMRQMWVDEGERRKVLQEKHQRGNVARSERKNGVQDRETRKMSRARRTENKKENIPSDRRNQHKTDPLKKLDAHEHTQELQQQMKSCHAQSMPMNNEHQNYHSRDLESHNNKKPDAHQRTSELQEEVKRSQHTLSTTLNTKHQNYNPQVLQPYNYKFQSANKIPQNLKPQHHVQQVSHTMQSQPNNYQYQRPCEHSSPLHGRQPPLGYRYQRSHKHSSPLHCRQQQWGYHYQGPREHSSPLHGRPTTSGHQRPREHYFPLHERQQSSGYQYQQPRENSSPLHGRQQPTGYQYQQNHEKFYLLVGRQEQQRLMMQRQLCRFYRQGRCHYGDNCKYWHD